MRLIISTFASLLVSISSTRADDLAAFKACIGPELEPRAQLQSDALPCRVSDNCPAEIGDRLDLFFRTVDLGCAGRQLEDCLVSGRPVECLSDFEIIMLEQRAAIIEATSPERLRAAVENVAGQRFRARRLEQSYVNMTTLDSDRLENQSAATTEPRLLRAEERLALPEGSLGRISDVISVWSQAREFDHTLERAEIDGASEGRATDQ